MTHPATRVVRIALVTGNQVHMQVEDGLSRSFPAVDADVVAVRVVAFLDGRSHQGQGAGQGLLFFRRGVEPAGDVPARDQKRMAGADRVLVPEADDQVGFVEDDIRVRATEWACRVHWEILSVATGSRRRMQFPQKAVVVLPGIFGAIPG